MTEPKAKPIIFSGEMVRAILDGRKSQTRRVLKDQAMWDRVGEGILRRFPNQKSGVPYSPGDRLWVREAFIVGWPAEGDVVLYEDEDGNELPPRTWYRADGDLESWVNDDTGFSGPVPWRSPIHMPKAASRLTLEVTEVRVQRLQEISEEDARAEGVEGLGCESDPLSICFSALWQSIHGPGAWAANPWVAAISFKRIAQEPDHD